MQAREPWLVHEVERVLIRTAGNTDGSTLVVGTAVQTCSAPPRRTMVAVAVLGHPEKMLYLSLPT
jgi:hypothetical protein